MFKHLIIVFAISINNIYTENLIGSPCTLQSSNSPGECKLLTECKEIQDEAVLGYKTPQSCGFEGTQTVVCCPKSRRPGDISEKKCSEYASYTKEKQLCGHNIVKRIVGGKPAGRTEFPHMAIFGYEKRGSENIQWLCGGSLISEQYILTAALCLSSRLVGEPKLVLLGVTNLNDTNHRREIKIINNVVHPEYRNITYYHDIALVKLEKPVEINSYVRPACLNTNFDFSVSQAIATGWGFTQPSGKRSEDLQKVTLDITDHQLCNNTYNKVLCQGIINDVHICTGSDNEKKGTCRGDVGGPLQIHHKNDPTLCMYDVVGVISSGIICSQGPSVNTRVSHYIKWIEDIVWPEKTQ
ncbi:venom protease-like isoform X2 [Zophobas morio]|uniref:venom protease-like isoform X2 n=1 Tax=Zophobas morio TaxID=2755281 RepID=UPI003082AC2A